MEQTEREKASGANKSNLQDATDFDNLFNFKDPPSETTVDLQLVVLSTYKYFHIWPLIMKFQTLICLIALIASVADAFTPAAQNRPRHALISSRASRPTALKATADEPAKKKKTKKKKKKKKAAVAAAAAPKEEKEPVVTFRKPEFVASIAEKTGMSKADSEAALAAVLETITEVSFSNHDGF
jgi:hypothetical protein